MVSHNTTKTRLNEVDNFIKTNAITDFYFYSLDAHLFEYYFNGNLIFKSFDRNLDNKYEWNRFNNVLINKKNNVYLFIPKSTIEDSNNSVFVKNITNHYIDRASIGKDVRRCLLHDPLAVAVAMDESIVEMKDYFVDVEYSSRLSDGQSICDFNNRYGKKPNVRVALELDRDKFMKMFLKSIIG